jgi:hypothetical protein
MMGLKDAVHKVALVSIACLCLSTLLPGAVLGGDLEPMGPPAPTMRTLESLGFDCPKDVASNTTNLLYTYVTNVAGFDTGFSISNTGADPFGTVPPACPMNHCTCTLNFYGASAPMPITTVDIPAVTTATSTYTNLTSTIAPGFTGYMIAVCNFPYAHGFAFISDVGARNLAMGYLAQVTCTDRGSNAMGSGR